VSETVKIALGSLGGALVALIGTVLASLLSYRSSAEDRALERDRLVADVRESLRDDLLEQYEAERERRQEAEARSENLKRDVQELKKFARAATRKLRAQEQRLDELGDFICDHPDIDEPPAGVYESSEEWPDVPPAAAHHREGDA